LLLRPGKKKKAKSARAGVERGNQIDEREVTRILNRQGEGASPADKAGKERKEGGLLPRKKKGRSGNGLEKKKSLRDKEGGAYPSFLGKKILIRNWHVEAGPLGTIRGGRGKHYRLGGGGKVSLRGGKNNRGMARSRRTSATFRGGLFSVCGENAKFGTGEKTVQMSPVAPEKRGVSAGGGKGGSAEGGEPA